VPVLGALEAAGVLVRGEIRPGGAELDWCDAEVLRRLKRRNLARLRDEVAAVDTATLAGFLPRWHGIGERRQGAERLREVIAQLQGLALPWSLWRDVVLPARVQGFRLEMLDMLAANGAVVWVGRGASGARDGRVALYLREQVRDLLLPEDDYEPPGELHRAILDVLAGQGASFLIEIETEVASRELVFEPREFRDALWDLVWAGQITNDTFGPLRELARGASRRRRRGAGPAGALGVAGGGRSAEVVAGGRWALVSGLAPGGVNPTKQAVARTRLLLDRYGIVSRQCLAGEDMPGGFGPIYKVLRELEEQGRVRRGYFVEGLAGAQFAYAGAVDRLRAGRAEAEERDHTVTADDIQVLSAMDPANPWGSQVPWPEVQDPAQGKPRRVASAWVLLARGRPVLYVAGRGRSVTTFPETIRDEDGALEAAIEALRGLPRAALKGALTIEKIDGRPAQQSALAEAFRRAGFESDYRGLMDARTPDFGVSA
ncbi:MAG: DEAD/DEAH box helicase, partial [Gammaproteobacteria bacterium]